LVGCVLRTIAEVSDMVMALWCFNPHLTQRRVKSPANREKLARLLAQTPPLDWPPFEVKELILFQSVLSPKGSTYTPLQVIPLG
jgi:2'-5' RNA ligase